MLDRGRQLQGEHRDRAPPTRLFCAIPLFHTYGMGACLTTFVRTGSTLVIMEEPNPFILNRGRALELLERHRVTIFPGVPFNFRLLADAADEADLSSLRACFSAGTALATTAFLGFHERYGVAVRQLYGSTETGRDDHQRRPRSGRHGGLRGHSGPGGRSRSGR